MTVVSDARLARLLDGAGFPRGELVTGVAIALAESGGDPGAHNTSGEDSRGLWQINVDAHPWGREIDLFQPTVNAAAAHRVWREAGESWDPWSTYSRWFTYRDYLGRARAAVTEALDGTASVDPTPSWRDYVGDAAAGAATAIPGIGPAVSAGKAVADAADAAGTSVGDVTSRAGRAASSAALDLLDPILPDPDTWVRIGVGAAGVAMIVGGAVVLLRDSAGQLAGAVVGDVAGGVIEGINQ